MWKKPHVISSHEGHARNIRHKGTTYVRYKKFYVLQDWSLLEIEFFGNTYITTWLLMTISKYQSTHIESSVLQVSSVLNICLKNGYAFHNVGKDGYQNTDSPCDQVDCNVGT
jgi:hypothetical protein